MVSCCRGFDEFLSWLLVVGKREVTTADKSDITWLIASIGSSSRLKTGIVRPESNWENSDLDKLLTETLERPEHEKLVFIIRIGDGGIEVEMIGVVQGKQCVRDRDVFRFIKFRIHKSEVIEKTSKQHSVRQGTFKGVFDFHRFHYLNGTGQCKGTEPAKCADIRYAFLSFSFPSLGELDKDAMTLLKRIRKFSVTQDIRARAAVHIFNRISFPIAKGVEAQLVSRLPTNFLQISCFF
ncbi:hypothetical protein Tco_1286126 [Tanacetum coccineum]